MEKAEGNEGISQQRATGNARKFGRDDATRSKAKM